jgi:hypothetical protein
MWTFDVLLIINLVVALYIWFDTDAIVEWASLLRLKFLKYKEFFDNKKSPVPMAASMLYTEFLVYKYGPESFLIRLITCPICFTVWVNIAVFCVFYSKVEVMMLGPNILMSWILYHVLRKILQKLND